jgi:aspartate racemase
MIKLGIVGGTGPESTMVYYQKLNYGYQNKRQRHDVFPSMTIESINIYEMLNRIARKDWQGTVDLLNGAIENLKNAGASLATLSAITPHIVFRQLHEVSPLPLVNMLELTANYCVANHYKHPLLLGTRFTMDHDFFVTTLQQAGIEVSLPTTQGREFVGNKIMSELEKGLFKDDTKQAFIKLINQFDQIDSVILGCTELPILIKQSEVALPMIDPMQIHIDYLVNQMTTK